VEVSVMTTYYVDRDGVRHAATTVMLPTSLKHRAKEYNINVSEITRRALVEEIERRERL
jgi:post-segregation antitoxin (ccd killing protein)